LVLLQFRYSPQHPILNSPQSMFSLPLGREIPAYTKSSTGVCAAL
jgi:hypothetical protein